MFFGYFNFIVFVFWVFWYVIDYVGVGVEVVFFGLFK